MNFEVTTNPEEVLKIAVNKLAELRVQIANLKRFEDDAKERITTILKQMKKDSCVSGKYMVSRKDVIRKSLDTKKVKEYLGDNAEEFMIETVSSRLDIKELK